MVRNQASARSEKSQALTSQTQAMLNLNMQLQQSAIKSQSKAIELELRRLDALQAADHLDLIQPYLPESFHSLDADSIRTLLAFKRFMFKCELLVKFLNDMKHDSKTAALEERLCAVQIKSKSAALCALLAQLVSFVSMTSVENFTAVGRVLGDVQSAEKR
jgi:dynactin 1